MKQFNPGAPSKIAETAALLLLNTYEPSVLSVTQRSRENKTQSRKIPGAISSLFIPNLTIIVFPPSVLFVAKNVLEHSFSNLPNSPVNERPLLVASVM